jgi:hypothetical protein
MSHQFLAGSWSLTADGMIGKMVVSQGSYNRNWDGRQQPILHGELAYKAMVTIAMSVESYRLGQTLYFDQTKQKVLTKPPVAPPKLKQL